jgi:hypothetical protein
MSFNIGTRVKSRFCGDGTVTGELIKETEIDEGKTNVICKQKVRFDLEVFGEREYEIKKLQTLDGDDGA